MINFKNYLPFFLILVWVVVMILKIGIIQFNLDNGGHYSDDVKDNLQLSKGLVDINSLRKDSDSVLYTQSSEHANTPCPKVFMYPLPDAWLDKRILPERGQADSAENNPFGDYLWQNSLGYHQTKHKSGPAIFERLLLNYGDLCLTDDPHKAVLFYIPWYRDWYCGIRKCDWYTKESEEERLIFSYIQNYSVMKFQVNFFQRNNGYDHFFVVLSAVLNLIPKDQKWFRGFYQNVTTVGTVGGASIYYPFASFSRFETGVDLNNLPWKYFDPPKSRLLFMAWGSIGGLRKHLDDQCQQAGDENVCQSFVTSRKEIYDTKDRSNSTIAFQEMVKGYQSSIFCANVGVETCSRKGFYDAVTNGCIVVAFESCPLEVFPEFFDVYKASILLERKYASRGLISRLQEISLDTITRMQTYIAENGHKLQFSKINSKEEYFNLNAAAKALVHEDAFFQTLHLVKRNRDRALLCDDSYQGFYQPRFQVCCPRSNECNPWSLSKEGVSSRCDVKNSVPCYFENPPYRSKIDPKKKLDYLIGPRFWDWGDLANYTTDASW